MIYCSEKDKVIIKNIIYKFYIEKKIMLNNPKLLIVIKTDFPWKSLY